MLIINFKLHNYIDQNKTPLCSTKFKSLDLKSVSKSLTPSLQFKQSTNDMRANELTPLSTESKLCLRKLAVQNMKLFQLILKTSKTRFSVVK